VGQGGGAGAGNMSGGAGGEGKSLEDMFYQKEMEISKGAFTRQFTYAIVYAWVKLREQVRLRLLSFVQDHADIAQETRNITWIAECIAQNQRERINNYISVF
jgi:V-type H+-transporting ATPase subunit d